MGEGKAKMEAGGYAEIVKPPNHDEYVKEKEREAEEKKAKKLAEKMEKNGTGVKRKGDEEDGPVEKKAKAENETPKVFKASYQMGSPDKALVKADLLNKKLWQDVMEKKYQNKKELTDKVEETFCCIICQDLVYEPVTTPCSHNICKGCLTRSFKAGVYSCPSCRTDLDKDYNMPVNAPLRAALGSLFPGYETGR